MDLSSQNLDARALESQSSTPTKRFSNGVKILVLVAALGLVVALLGLFSENSDVAECKRLVKDSLKSPSSAKFIEASVFYGTHPLTGEKTVKVEGVVDAQNSFGAVLANDFYCSKIDSETLVLEYVTAR